MDDFNRSRTKSQPSARQTHVAFYEVFTEEADLLRSALPANIRATYTACSAQETDTARPPAPLVCIRTQSKIPVRWLPHLKGILTRSTGYDHLMRYRRANLALGYLPEYCVRAVAEQALLLALALLRKLPQQMRQFNTFDRNGLTGAELKGRTLTVVGVGRIGGEIARIGAALGMRVLGVDIVRRHADVTYVSPAQGLRQADVIICAMNLTAQNHHYFDRHVWRRVRPGTVFVNIARGELAPVADLLWALKNGRLGGVGLDVFEDEGETALALRRGAGSRGQLRQLRELAGYPNVILTPHNAFNTEEALRRKVDQTVQEVVRFLRGEGFTWPVPESDH